mmetsp:Transcript_5692/g.17967  ORF Transcript_5692/g.17967 Transcript_5692/m.17967 type:complete len:238 (-) Transcript_5692:23-736(-)
MNSVKQFFGAAEEPKPAYSILGGAGSGGSIFGGSEASTSNPLADAAAAVSGAANSASLAARRAVGAEIPPEERNVEEMVFESCPTMTFKQRVIALVVCCCLGYALEICGTLTLIGGPSAKNIRKFSVLYVLGNLIAIMATAFWVGPKFMCKKMFKSSRRCATCTYLLCLVLVFVLALLKVALGFVLLMLTVELCAAVWYSASFLPKGRWCVIQCCKKSLFSPCPEVLDPVQRSLPVV